MMNSTDGLTNAANGLACVLIPLFHPPSSSTLDDFIPLALHRPTNCQIILIAAKYVSYNDAKE